MSELPTSLEADSGAAEPKDMPMLQLSAKPDVAEMKAHILNKLAYSLGKDPTVAQPHDWVFAASLAVRDRMIDVWRESTRQSYKQGKKRVYYLSLEFLIGRTLGDALVNLGLSQVIGEALAELGADLDIVSELEPDAALGNGGLGRLAACYLESMSTLGIPAFGYGIRYDYGLFKQQIVDGRQTEIPEDWLQYRNPWELERRESAYPIGFGGHVENDAEAKRTVWTPSEIVMAVAYDTPVVGWRGKDANTLRLWRARSTDPLKLDAFNSGDHVGAQVDRNRAESISRVLYPADTTPAGQELRLRQEYFFSSASLQDLVRRHMRQFGDIRLLSQKASIQLNDTHPSLAVPELMRILMDEHELSWDDAWDITVQTIAYTNHTLLPEALESWPVNLIERMLPRHMQIIFGINALFMAEIAKSEHAPNINVAAVSLIDEHHGRRVRMGNLAFIGSHSVNGVSALHSELLKQTVFHDMHKLYPGRINNKTNGITPRRWFIRANAPLARLAAETVGDGVMDDISLIKGLAAKANDATFQDRFSAIRLLNKRRLAKYIHRELGVRVDPQAMFDVHIKRIHEYKRQLLNILETVALYDAIRTQPNKNWAPRVKIFAGKAAASYHQAKMVIHLINDVARVVNNDPATRGLLKVVFLPNYNVSLAEMIIPATDLSEQISTAGMEASGTGNMKFMLNGALTIGTLDGANIEMCEQVGRENMFIFGMNADQVQERRVNGYAPMDAVNASQPLAEVLDAIASGAYSHKDRNRYTGFIEGLRQSDWFMVFADFDAYAKAQREAAALWLKPQEWNAKSILNMASAGWFSSDRAIKEYADEIWNVPA